jgi:predicted enzyme related to lactoylglutathione lyase
MIRVGSIVIRVNDLQKQAEFWSNALHYKRHINRHDFIVQSPTDGTGPNISLDTMRSDVQVPPRIHLDLYADDQTDEVQRLIGLGATEVHWEKRPADADYVILADPEGNRFCGIDASD